MKKIIHVNRQNIAMNANSSVKMPVFTIKGLGKSPVYAHEVEILGPSKMIYSSEPLSCGAKAWIETDAELELVGRMSFKEARALGHEQEADEWAGAF